MSETLFGREAYLEVRVKCSNPGHRSHVWEVKRPKVKSITLLEAADALRLDLDRYAAETGLGYARCAPHVLEHRFLTDWAPGLP